MLTTDELKRLLPGATLYHELAKGSPQGEEVAVFAFGEYGRAAARLPGGTVMRGEYAIRNDAYGVNWDGGLQNSRSTLTACGPHGWICRNADTGVTRSTVTRLVRGDAESLLRPG